MSKIALMCDSSADITEQEAKELDIHVLRMPIVIKDKEYKICKKMPDAYINKYIQELNEEKDDIDVLYKINKNGDMIEFCESWIKYIMENKNSILYLIKHKLISYLETKNPNDNKIEFKLGKKLATDKNLSF